MGKKREAAERMAGAVERMAMVFEKMAEKDRYADQLVQGNEELRKEIEELKSKLASAELLAKLAQG